MSFKRTRPLHYNVHPGQVIIQNGVPQPSPLDRKILPLEGQKKISLTVSSADRDAWDAKTQSFTTTPTECVVRLRDTVKGVYGYRVMEFVFRNMIYNIQAGVNDTLQVSYATPPAPLTNPDSSANFITDPADPVISGTIRVPPGMYTAYWNLNDIFFALVVGVSLNELDISNWTLLPLFKYDLRVALFLAAKGVITHISTNPATGFLTITWTGENPTIVMPGAQAPGAPAGLGSSIISRIPFGEGTTGNVWTTNRAIDAATPETIGIRSPLLNNSEVLDPDGDNEFFLHVPVLVDPGKKQKYAPKVPNFVNFNSQQTISRIEFNFYDHETGSPLVAPDMEWQMLLELFTLDASPAT